MALLSDYARRKKLRHFLADVDRSTRILEIGPGEGWLREWCRRQGYEGYVSLDLTSPADFAGPIERWRELGIEPGSFDVIVAFEVVEHVDCFQDCWEILRPGGRLMVTTPVPRMDWLLRLLEAVGLNQPRGTPHDHLVDLRTVPWQGRKNIRIVAGLSQWAIFHKTNDAPQ